MYFSGPGRLRGCRTSVSIAGPNAFDYGDYMNRLLLSCCVVLASLFFVSSGLHAQTSSGEIVGTPTTGEAGITLSVQEIMARESLRPTAPFTGQYKEMDEFPLRPTPSANPLSPMTSSWPALGKIQTPSDRQTFLNPQTVGTSFQAIQVSESGFIPPDCGADVGPTQILVHLNGRIKVFSKSGVLGALNADDLTFWTSVRGTAGVSDPHIRYDRLSKRWIVVAINVAATNNRIVIAVSSDSVITGTGSFTFFQFAMNTGGGGSSDNGGFADYPTLGVDANALYIGLNIFNAAGNAVLGTTAFVVRKSSVLAGPIVYTAFRQLTNGTSTQGPWTPQGVDNDEPGSTEGYFIGVDFINYGQLDIRRISTPGATPTISSNIVLTVPATIAPVLQQHEGEASDTSRLDALDDRLFAAQLKKNKLTGVATLWTAQNIAVNASGVATAGGRNGSRWYQIGSMTTTPTLIQSGTLYDPGASNIRGYWIPTIAMSGQGHAAMGTSYASLNDFAGVAVAGRLASDVSGTIQAPTLAFVASTAYNVQPTTNGQRWGDYSSTVVDPNDDMTFWTFQEYTNATNSWATRVVQLKAPLPAAPTSALPSSAVAGASNVNVTVTGTSSGGTGFFDPGAGYSRRISASVGGAGVTVNSVTFTNPTSVVLNLSVAPGALAGARTVTVMNPDSQAVTSASGIFTVSVASCPTVILSPSTLTNGTAGTPYSQTITASGGLAPYGYTVTAGALPAGVTLTGAGLLSGTPTFGGVYNFSVTATDANFCTGVQAYTWTVTGCPQITLAPATLPNDTIGIAYSQSVTASGGTGPYTYAISAGALPPGITLSAGGALSGAPTLTGSYSFTVRATDANLCQGTRAYSVQIFCPSITLAPATLPSDTVGKAYSQPVTSSGGTPSYTYSVSAGAIPTGLTLSSGGLLSGTLTTVGVYSFTILSTDGIACTGSRAYSVTVYAVFVPNTISLAVQGTAVIENFDGMANSGATSSTLPTGWFLNEVGTNANTTYGIDNGTNTAGNTYSYGATSASDRAFGMLQSGTLATPTIGASVTNNTGATITSLGIAYVGEEWRLGTRNRFDSLQFKMSLDATSLTTGTWTPYYSLDYATTDTSGAAGARDGNVKRTTVSSTISGLSIANGATFWIRWSDFSATGSDDGLAVDSFAITANPGFGAPTNPTASGASSPSSVVVGNTSLLTVTVTPGTNPTSTGITVTTNLSTVGGSSAQTFYNDGTHGDVTNGDNLWTFRDTVTLATSPGLKSLAVSVQDAQLRSASASIGLTVVACPTITILPASLPNAGLGVAYNQTVTASGGTIPYVFTLQTPGTLPSGLALAAGGGITGTPTAIGTSNFTVVVTDSNGCTATKAYSIQVTCPAISMLPASLLGATISTPYNQTVTASGGTSPYAYALQTPNTLPTGLSLSSGGAITGTPTATGTSNFTVVATDAHGCTGTKAYSIQVSCPSISILPASLPAGTINIFYNQTVTPSGGKAPYSCTLQTPGTLPVGLSLSSAGIISGTPTATGLSNFTVVVADSNGCPATKGYSIQVSCPVINVLPASLPAAAIGTPYNQTVTASGGTSPYGYALQTPNTLPVGLSLSALGVITGTPTTPGNSNFTVVVTDSSGCTAAKPYAIQSSCPTITLSPAVLAGGTAGVIYSHSVTASGGTAPYTFTPHSGAMPPGLTLATSGSITGTPTASGVFPVTIQAADANGCQDSLAYTLNIGCTSITLSPASLPAATVGTAYAQAVSATGGTGSYAYSVTLGSLPASVTLSGAGLLSGTPSAAFAASFTVTATDSFGCQGSKAYSLQATCPALSVSPASLPNGTKGSLYSLQLAGSGGTSPYTFQVTLATPPAGITLSASGLLSGTPTATGNFPFTVTATDTFGCQGMKAYSLQVDCPVVSVLPSTLADDSVAHPVSLSITASGGTGAYTFTVSAGSLPTGVTLSSAGLLAGLPSSAGTYSFTITATGSDACAGSRPYSWQINASSQVVVGVPLQAKWNIISNPLRGGNDSVTAVYPAALASAYAFLPGSGYSSTALIPHGAGYWIKFGSAQTATLIGFPDLADTIAVEAGWNLVGALAEKLPASSVVPVGTTIASQFYGYQAGYSVSDTLRPGLGYWVNVSATGTLVFSSSANVPASMSSASPRHTAEDPPVATIVISDAAGNTQQLFVGRKGSDGGSKLFALPPAPPNGVFDVRFATDRMMEISTGRRQELAIRISSAIAPVTIGWKRDGGEDVRMVLSGTDGARSPLRAELDDAGSVTLKTAQNLILVLDPKKAVPTSFALLQNYPNPFNPVTTIQFDLPVRSVVSVSVLNILGEQVTLLHNRSELGPGREDISWDASSFPSGIYFYRLSAQPLSAEGAAPGSPFTSTKKMILIK